MEFVRTTVAKEKLPTVSFNIGLPENIAPEAVYITGDIDALGNWDPAKAVRVKRSKRGAYNKTIRLPLGTAFQFKVISYQAFTGVEKGRYFEELENRHGKVAAEKNKFIVEVKAFLNAYEF